MVRMAALTLALTLPVLLAGCVGTSAPPPRPLRTATTWNPPASPDSRMCLANLSQNYANFTPLPDQYYGAGCSALGAVRLMSLRSDGGTLQISNLGPVTCPLASTLSGWARFGVDRAARAILGSPLVRIETMGSYACRNVAGTSRLSAHASANAVDVSGFVLADGRRISVLRDWDSENPQIRAFLATIRTSACKRFGTVLSPQYNAAHRDHFHLEVGGGRPFCQ